MKLIKISLAILLTANVNAVMAQLSGEPVPNVFTSGAPAVAEQVNENFQELADRIQGDSLVYDYKDYFTGANVAQKTFVVEGLCGDIETRVFSRVPTVEGTRITYRRVLRDTELAEDCSINDFVFLATPTEFLRIGLISYELESPDEIRLLRTYTNAVLRTNSMSRGKKILNTVARSDAYPSDPLREGRESITTRQTEVISIEDVKVPAGTYEACMKTEYKWGASTSVNMSWFCEGVGLVKTLTVFEDLSERDPIIKELQSITTTP